MFEKAMVTILQLLGSEAASQVVEYLKGLIENSAEIESLAKKIRFQLAVENANIKNNSFEAEFFFDKLAVSIESELLRTETLTLILTTNETTRNREISRIQNSCISEAKAINNQAKAKVKEIVNKCVQVVENYFRSKLTYRDLVLARLISDEIIHCLDESIKKQTEELFKNLIKEIHTHSRLEDAHLILPKSDNQVFLDSLDQPLFLDQDNHNITLRNMFIPPLVVTGKEEAAACVSRWYISDYPLMILFGEAGIGKTSFIAKLVSESCSNCLENPNNSSVLAVVLRDHSELFNSLPNGYSPKSVICKLFGVEDIHSLDNKMLILDGFDELTVLSTGFDGAAAASFIKKLVLACRTSNLKLHILITSREGYFPEDDKLYWSEILCWRAQQVDDWCVRYSTLKPSCEDWCLTFVSQYHDVFENDDERYKVLCIPFILYLCCNSRVNLEENKTICQIYDKAFRTLLLRKHGEKFLASELFEDNETEERKRVILWQYTKEIAYQMFLLDTLDLKETDNPSDLRQIGLKNAKARTIAVLNEKYSPPISESELSTTEFLSVFSFAMRDEERGITFAHKTVYEFFTAVKLYEDYFAIFNDEFFKKNSTEVQAQAMVQMTLNAFRYHSIPSDIFEYLCEMTKAPFQGKDEETSGFNFQRFIDTVQMVMNSDNNSKYLSQIPAPINEYYYPLEESSCYDSINTQITRAFRCLICFINGHGYKNKNPEEIAWICDFLHDSDQYIELDEWNLEGLSLFGANFRNAILANTNLTDAELMNSDFENAYFIGVQMCNADLSYSNMENASFVEANFSDTLLIRANLGNSVFTDCIYDGAVLICAELESATLKNEILNSVNFRGAGMSNTVLKGSTFNNSNFAQVVIFGSNLTGTKFNDSDFSGADMSGVNLSNSHMKNVVLNRADLSSANLKKAHLINTDVSSAIMSNVDLKDTKIEP